MKNIVLLAILLVGFALNAAETTNINVDATLSDLKSAIKIGLALNKTLAQIESKRDFQTAATVAINAPTFSKEDVTSAADMAGVANKFLDKRETNIVFEIKSCLSGAISTESLSLMTKCLENEITSLSKANFTVRLPIAYAKISRVENKRLQYPIEQRIWVLSLDTESWKQPLEVAWNRNQIILHRMTNMVKFTKELELVFKDLEPIAPPAQLSAAIRKAYSDEFPGWIKQ